MGDSQYKPRERRDANISANCEMKWAGYDSVRQWFGSFLVSQQPGNSACAVLNRSSRGSWTVGAGTTSPDILKLR